MVLPGALSSCSDGVLNGGEAGIDCGGSCPVPCPVSVPNGGSHEASTRQWPLLMGLLATVAVIIMCFVVVAAVIRRRRRIARDRVSAGKAVPNRLPLWQVLSLQQRFEPSACVGLGLLACTCRLLVPTWL